MRACPSFLAPPCEIDPCPVSLLARPISGPAFYPIYSVQKETGKGKEEQGFEIDKKHRSELKKKVGKVITSEISRHSLSWTAFCQILRANACEVSYLSSLLWRDKLLLSLMQKCVAGSCHGLFFDQTLRYNNSYLHNISYTNGHPYSRILTSSQVEIGVFIFLIVVKAHEKMHFQHAPLTTGNLTQKRIVETFALTAAE